MALQKQHGIITGSYGPLTPILRHPTGGPLKPVLQRIATRLSSETGRDIDAATVLLLWTRQTGVVTVSASGNADRIKKLAEVSMFPDLLHPTEVEEITNVGTKIYFRFYVRKSYFPVFTPSWD